jgi:hypothetical protein
VLGKVRLILVGVGLTVILLVAMGLSLGEGDRLWAALYGAGAALCAGLHLYLALRE